MLITCILDTLSMMQGSLFCFACHAEISKITVLHVVLLVYSESSWVHRLCLRLFGAMVCKHRKLFSQ
jgi:hypothetical protein